MLPSQYRNTSSFIPTQRHYPFYHIKWDRFEDYQDANELEYIKIEVCSIEIEYPYVLEDILCIFQCRTGKK